VIILTLYISEEKKGLINRLIIILSFVMPDLIRHPGTNWIPASAGMTACRDNYETVNKSFHSQVDRNFEIF